MRQILCWMLIATMGMALTGCSSAASKAAAYKAKDISPVHDTKAEKASKKVDNIGGDEEGGLLKDRK